MKKKILAAMFAAMIAATSLGAPEGAFAAGEATVEDEANASSPGSPMQGNAQLGTAQKIEVKSKESGNVHEIVYNIKITWGDMNFEYYYGPTWNPSTHSYENPDDVSVAGWKTSYLNGTNNKISVANNSNYPVDVKMSFSPESGRFNNTSANDSVCGVFNKNNETLRNSINGANVADCGSKGNISFALASADVDNTGNYFNNLSSKDENIKANTQSCNVFFGLWGKPDKSDQHSNQFDTAGEIKVTVTPHSEN